MTDGFIHILLDCLRTSTLVSGLVIIMMMLIEVFNLKSQGRLVRLLAGRKPLQVLLSALLGSIPGCMGGFASVSMYNHGMLGFGALVAMMIASSGDEAFLMLAMFPGKAVRIFAGLFVLAVIVGLVLSTFDGEHEQCHSMQVHDEDLARDNDAATARHFGWQRILMLLGILLFVFALLSGMLGHDNDDGPAGFSLLSEEWMYWLFSAMSAVLVIMLCLASDHFVEEHLWHHIICHHLPGILAWTAGTVLVVGLIMQSMDTSAWISDNTALMIFIAALMGLIPESGPHMVFVTMFAAGVVPMPVLLASCISQDGHASLPLLAESRRAWVMSKLLNVLVAMSVGYVSLLIN